MKHKTILAYRSLLYTLLVPASATLAAQGSGTVSGPGAAAARQKLKIYRSLPCFSRLRIRKNHVLLTPKHCGAQISVNATAITGTRRSSKPVRLKIGDTLKLLDQHTVRAYRLLTIGDSHAKFAYRSFWWGVAGSGQRRETIVTRTYSQPIPR